MSVHIHNASCRVIVMLTIRYAFSVVSQPVAEVLAYLHVQISPISCNVVGSILHVLGKNTDTAIVGYRWTGMGSTPSPVLLTGANKSGVPD